jgi:hypothetical protein
MTTEITKYDDVIDSRDIIARIEELRALDPFTDDDLNELQSLEKLAAEGETLDDWEHGLTLIRDSYFTDHTREMLEDCGYIPKDLPSWIEIDFKATARNVQIDYTPLDFAGRTYWAR